MYIPIGGTHLAGAGWVALTSIAIIATVLTVGYYLITMRSVFFGAARPEMQNAVEAPASMLFPMSILLALAVIFGFLNAPILRIILDGSAAVLRP